VRATPAPGKIETGAARKLQVVVITQFHPGDRDHDDIGRLFINAPQSSTMRRVFTRTISRGGFSMVTLDGQSSLWAIGILSFLIGIVLGWIITYTLVVRHGRTHQLQLELDQLKENFRDYRDQVTHHFMRTSELVQEMTQSYRSVYEHLASGAQHLCGDPELASLDHRAPAPLTADSDPDGQPDEDYNYDEYAELSRIRDDIDELLGEAPRISDMDAEAEDGVKRPRQH
jgi:uncharacterized membrane-anchored protein YhcB (DUF1043 family)